MFSSLHGSAARRCRTLSWFLFGVSLAGLLLTLGYYLLSTKPALRVILERKTNQFGFPIGNLIISNELPARVAVFWDIEALRSNWVKIVENHSSSLSPHEVLTNDVSHPIPEGLWRIRVRWMRVRRGRLYTILEKAAPRLLQRLDREGISYSEPMEAWQPPEIRKR